MRSRIVYSPALRAALFVTCATCTLWLLVQNTILFTIMPWHRLVPALETSSMVRAAIVGISQWSLVPIAFALGWLVSRPSARASESRERFHE